MEPQSVTENQLQMKINNWGKGMHIFKDKLNLNSPNGINL